MTYLATQFALYLVGACILGLVIGWSLSTRRAARRPTASATTTAQRAQAAPVSTSIDAAGTQPADAAPARLRPAPLPPPPIASPVPASPVPAPPTAPVTPVPAPPAAAEVSAAAVSASKEETARLRRELDRLTVKLQVLEATATASPMAVSSEAHSRLTEQIEQQRHTLAAQSMELAVLRARYDGARSELERVQRVSTGSPQ